MRKYLVLRKNQGFSLIEILIILTIGSLLTAGTVSYYHQFTEQKKLDAQTANLDDALHLFQKKAMVGDLGGLSCAGKFDGYQFRYDYNAGTGEYSYNVYFCCNGACGNFIKQYILESPVTLSNFSNFIFQQQTGGVSTAITIDLTNSTISKCRRITIGTSGLINIANSCT